MPSLNALGEFKFSFRNIANEKNDIEARNAPYVDLPLPKTEAAPSDFPAASTADTDIGGFDFSSFLDTLPGDITPPPLDDIFDAGDMGSGDLDDGSQTDINFDDFLSSIDTGGEPAAVIPDAETDTLPEALPPDPLGDMDLAVPSMDDLLGGIDSAEPSAAPSMDDLLGNAGFGLDEETPADVQPSDIESEDDVQPSQGVIIDDPFSLDIESNEMPAVENLDNPFETMDEHLDSGIDLGGEEPPADSPGMDELLGGLDLGETEEVLDDASSDDASSGDASSGDEIEGIELLGEDRLSGISDDGLFDAASGADSFSGDTGESPYDASGFDDPFNLNGDVSPLGDFDIPLGTGSEEQPLSDSGLGDNPFNMDGLNLGDFESESIELGSEPMPQDSSMDFSGGGFSESSDFELPGLEEIFDKNKSESLPKPPPKKGFFKKRKTSAADLPEAESDVEEIQLTQDDVDRLLDTIASYPLNKNCL